MIQTLRPFIAEHAYFRGVDGDLIDLSVGCAKNVRATAGEYIFKEGADADVFYLVRHGRVAIEVRTGSQPMVVATLGPGDVLGWSWLLPDHPWAFDARAVDLTRLVSLDCGCLRAKCDENPRLGFALLQRSATIMERHLYQAWTQLADLYGPT